MTETQKRAEKLYGKRARIYRHSDEAALLDDTATLLSTADELQSGNTEISEACRNELGSHGLLTLWSRVAEDARTDRPIVRHFMVPQYDESYAKQTRDQYYTGQCG